MTTTPPAEPRRNQQQGSPSHHIAVVAAALRVAARGFDVTLTPDYAKWVTADALARCDQLGITPLGDGIVIHTAPNTPDQLPILVGYADRNGLWTRTGQRWQPTTPTAQADPTAPSMQVEL